MQNHDIGRAAIPTKTPGESPPWLRPVLVAPGAPSLVVASLQSLIPSPLDFSPVSFPRPFSLEDSSLGFRMQCNPGRFHLEIPKLITSMKIHFQTRLYL